MTQEIAGRMEDSAALLLSMRKEKKEKLSVRKKLLHPRVMAILSVVALWYVSSWITWVLTETLTLPWTAELF